MFEQFNNVLWYEKKYPFSLLFLYQPFLLYSTVYFFQYNKYSFKTVNKNKLKKVKQSF